MSDPEKRTVLGVVVGAYREALAETGLKRVFLLAMLTLMTVPIAPLWVLLAVLEWLGIVPSPGTQGGGRDG